MKNRSPVRLVSELFLAVFVLAAAPVLSWADALTESQTRLLSDVKFLASDELQGRGVETEGINRAAEFIRDEFQKAGLDVTKVEGGAFQTFSMVTGTELGKENALTLTGPDEETISLKYDEQFRTCSFGGSGQFEGEVVFLGYAIDSEEYNDIPEDLDFKGKVAIIIRRNPQQGNPHGPFASSPHGGVSRHAALTSKISHAYRKGAAAVLFVNDTYTDKHAEEELEQQIEKASKQLAEVAEQLQSANPGEKEKN